MLFSQLLFLRKHHAPGAAPTPGHRFRRPRPGRRSARDRRWWRRQVVNTLLLAAGVFSAAFGLESFLLPGGFLDGGVTGVSLLLRQVFGVPLPVLIVVLNIPFVLMAWRAAGPGRGPTHAAGHSGPGPGAGHHPFPYRHPGQAPDFGVRRASSSGPASGWPCGAAACSMAPKSWPFT